jgi:hypothetical protein
VKASETDVTIRPSDIVVHCEPAPDPESSADARHEPILDPDDREEAGYGYGV